MPYKSAATEQSFPNRNSNFPNGQFNQSYQSPGGTNNSQTNNFDFQNTDLTVSDQELTALLSQKDIATSLAEDLLKHFGSETSDLDIKEEITGATTNPASGVLSSGPFSPSNLMDNGTLIKQENNAKPSTPAERKFSPPVVEIKTEILDNPEVKEEFLEKLKDEDFEYENFGDKEPELTIDMPARQIMEISK